jgi:tripartite-type tricarboxylate transporter receptor subunit TctC
MKDRIVAMGFDPLATTPDELAERTKAEIARWSKVIRDARIQPD